MSPNRVLADFLDLITLFAIDDNLVCSNFFPLYDKHKNQETQMEQLVETSS